MCTPCSDCVENMYGNVKNTCAMYTPACTGAQDSCLVHTTLTAKMHIHTRQHARATVQQLFAMQTIATHLATWALLKKRATYRWEADPGSWNVPNRILQSPGPCLVQKIKCNDGSWNLKFSCRKNSISVPKIGRELFPSDFGNSPTQAIIYVHFLVAGIKEHISSII